MNNELLRTINELSRRLERLETLEAQRRHIAIRAQRTTAYTHPGGSSWQVISLNVVDFNSHPNLSIYDGTGFTAPITGYYYVAGALQTSTTSPITIYVGVFVNGIVQSLQGLTVSATFISCFTAALVYMTAGSTVRLGMYSNVAEALTIAAPVPFLDMMFIG